MKNNMLNEILNEVKGISERVKKLEVASEAPAGISKDKKPDWLKTTYPKGYMTIDDLFEQAPDPAENCHQIMGGMVIGDGPEDDNVIHPLVPMMFHDGQLGYACKANSQGIVSFNKVRTDLPCFIGSFDQAEGLYVPLDCSRHGIDVAREVLDEIESNRKAEEKMHNTTKEYYTQS